MSRTVTIGKSVAKGLPVFGFVLEGPSLRMTATVMNRGETAMPFCFGYHPAFAWPLPYGGSVEEHRIRFAQAEPAPIRKVGSEPGLIALESVPSPVEGMELAPTHAMFAGDALIWDDLASRSLTWGVPGRPHLKIDFQYVIFLLIMFNV